MKNRLGKTTETRKTDRILFGCAVALFIAAVALWAVALVLFLKSEFSTDHVGYFTACLLLACGGISALGAAACLFFSPLLQDKRRRVCPFCGAKIKKTDVYCGACGKRFY